MKSYTDIEQSRKLTEVLSLESADNVIVKFGDREGIKTVVMPKETLDVLRTPFSDIREVIPCWSLAALLTILSFPNLFENDGWNLYTTIDEKLFSINNADNPVDACYELILKLHEQNLL